LLSINIVVLVASNELLAENGRIACVPLNPLSYSVLSLQRFHVQKEERDVLVQADKERFAQEPSRHVPQKETRP